MTVIVLRNSLRLHQATVGGGFLLQFHRVGARGGEHDPEAHQAVADDELAACTHLRHRDAIADGEDWKSRLADAYDGATAAQAA